ncbi:MAG: hypothetical protein J0L53_15370 [Spirochaetes bacterium]|nr:hypothetical protein [Spirochaetota bacterium]MBX3722478.1 hypothetical protein [Turneriella sp.]
MGFLTQAVDQAGALVLTIPCALIVLLTREWYAAKMTGDKDAQLLAEFPLVSFACLALNGAAPGGLLRDKPMPLLRFLHGQLWLVVLLAVGVLYVLLKSPAPDTFSARFSAVFLTQTWGLLLLNFIPLPPFDAAATYFGPYMQWKMFSVLVIFLSIVVFVLLSYNFWRGDFVTGKFLLRWLHLV